MKNFIFISPNFPANYWHFCRELRNNGVNVLGIGDAPYYDLTQEQRDSLTEYYKVSTLEDFGQMYRAVAYFAFRYGKIDGLESNNEYWLEQDAKLREEFNIPGLKPSDMARLRYKSGMKKYYKKAGIPAARFHMVDTKEGCKRFIKKVGWPVIVKPDNGVGASHTYRLESEKDLDAFFAEGLSGDYTMEEFVRARVESYDAVIGPDGEPMFETGNVTPESIMDVVNNSDNSMFYIRAAVPDDIRQAGRAALKAFDVKSRFVHFEFFRLTEDQYLGKKGQVVGLEVNLRPSGGVSPDMMNYASGTDVYKIWADMVAFGKTEKPCADRQFCVFASRRSGRSFALSADEVRTKYAAFIKEEGPVPEALSGAMADYMFLACFASEDEVWDFAREVFLCV